ncbi:hypothetical protein G7046_g4417 [Stylonectria norvegica]|nr:hypothetical protein G7046_g4417 [Stylonectria norvegica]
MSNNLNMMRQSFFAGKPKFTVKELPDLSGKTIIVTGSNTGVGKEIAQMVYAKNARVYIMARSETKSKKAIDDIRAAVPNSQGELVYIPLDLSDLRSTQKSAAEFLRRESQLHVLFNNAGVGYPEAGSRTKQDYELQLGVNCIGTFAFTQQLTPTLVSTAKASPPGTVRVVWASSTAALATPTKDYMKRIESVKEESSFEQYCLSKLGNYFYATEFASRYRADGIISIPLNPGNINSEFWRTQGALMLWVLRRTVLHPPVYGAYTNIFAGFSPSIAMERSGTFVAPCGRLWYVSHDMLAGSKSEAQGGNSTAEKFWNWTEAQVRLHQ